MKKIKIDEGFCEQAEKHGSELYERSLNKERMLSSESERLDRYADWTQARYASVTCSSVVALGPARGASHRRALSVKKGGVCFE